MVKIKAPGNMGQEAFDALLESAPTNLFYAGQLVRALLQFGERA